MKKTLLVALGLSLPVFSFAAGRALDTAERAILVKDSIQEPLFEINGVNGIGVGACDPDTGEESMRRNFVHCVVIRTSTKAAEKKILKMYPQGTRVRGVFIAVKFIGKIVPQPRMSVGG